MFGLDGVPHGMIRELADDGIVPFIAEVISNSSLKQMETTIPPISSVAWSSFLTGKNPGEHGIFGFVDVKPGSYETFFPNFTHLKAPVIWEDPRLTGIRTLALNIPSTYPARALNGVMVSGFVVADPSKAVYPRSYARLLEQCGYAFDVDVSIARRDPDRFIEQLFKALKARFELFKVLVKAEQWELLIAVETGSDRLHHVLYNAFDDPTHPHHGDFIDYYRELDRQLSELFELIPANCHKIFLSDHGFCSLEKEFNLNVYLQDKGYLYFKSSAPTRLSEIDGKRSLCFSLDPGRIYINSASRFPCGIVPSSYRTHYVERMICELGELCDDVAKQNPIFRSINQGGDIYHGEFAPQAADILLLPRNGIDLKGAVSKHQQFTPSHFSGMHTQDDAFCILPAEVTNQKSLHIEVLRDIIIQYLLGTNTEGRC